MKKSLRLLAIRTASVLMIALASIAAVVFLRTLVARPADSVAPLEYEVPALDVAAAAANLGTALRFATISHDEATEAPDFPRFRDWLVATYPRFHAATRRTLVGGGTLIHEWSGSDKSLQPIVLMAHQDVVPVPQPERWRQGPFSGALVDGDIWGRGALDDKSSLIAMLEAAESLLAAGHVPERDFIFIFGHDEEAGGSGARAAAELLASRGIKAAFVLDEGGIALRNAPVTNGSISLIGIAEKGYVTLELEVSKAGGHSNAPGTETAVDVLAKAIVAIRGSAFPLRYAGVTRSMLESMAPDAPWATRLAIANSWLFEPLLLGQLTSTPQGAATLQTTLAPTMLQASPKSNVLPSIAKATLNLRIIPGETIDGVIAHVRAAMGDLPVALRRVGPSAEPSPVASTRSGGYRLVSGLAAATFDSPVAPLLVIGLTDSRFMRVLTDDIYRFSPFQLTSQDIGIVHGIDERISLDNFARMLAFYSQLIVGGSAATLP